MSYVAPAYSTAWPGRRARTETAKVASGRQHYWDFARGALMLLGIPYHVAMCLRDGNPWIVASPRGGAAYTWIADLIHVFRMPAFFLVAGYFAAMLLARRAPGDWLRGRLLKLGVPFAVSLLLVVPVLNLACELSGGGWAHAEGMFAKNMSESGGYWIRHLWFLIVLGYYSALAAALVTLAPRLAHARLPLAIEERLARAFPLVLIGAGLALGAYAWAAALPFHDIGRLGARRLQEILRLDEALAYLPYFAIGALLQRSRALLVAVGTLSPGLLAVTALVTIAAVAAQHRPDLPLTGTLLAPLAALLLAQALLAAARRWFDRPSPAVDALVAAAFPIYLLHLPILAVLLDLVIPLGWPLWIEFVAVCAATLALSFAAARGIARVPVLNLLFNGVVLQRG